MLPRRLVPASLKPYTRVVGNAKIFICATTLTRGLAGRYFPFVPFARFKQNEVALSSTLEQERVLWVRETSRSRSPFKQREHRVTRYHENSDRRRLPHISLYYYYYSVVLVPLSFAWRNFLGGRYEVFFHSMDSQQRRIRGQDVGRVSAAFAVIQTTPSKSI